MTRKLNICIVHHNRNAFSETFIRNHIKHLPGNIFDLYGSWFPAFDRNDNRISNDFINRNFLSRLIVFACKLLPAFIANRIPSRIKGYPYDEEMNEAGFKYFLVNNRIDVVLAEFMVTGVVIKDVCTKLKIPFVVHTHGGGDIMNDVAIQNHLSAFPDMFHKVAKVISVDSYSSAKLFELGLEKRKLVEIGLGVDINLFTATIPSLNDPVFLAIGRLVNKKAPYLTILAFSGLLKIHPGAKLVIAGIGNLLDCCTQLVKALKITSSVSFVGVLTPPEVSGIMQKSRAFLQHSVHTADGDSEGIPVAILEAMACGLPVISTNHNGIADTIKHGYNGLLVEENDVDTMAQYMIKLVEEPLYADQLGSTARQKIEDDFEMSKVIGNLYCILEEAVRDHEYQEQNG